MFCRWSMVAVVLCLGACQEGEDEPPPGALGAVCGQDLPCVEGTDPICIAPDGQCGLNPPFSGPCDDRPRCVECGADDDGDGDLDVDPACPAPEGEA